MTLTTSAIQKALAHAASRRTSKTAGRGWDQHSDRDLARQTHDLYYLAQTSSPRVL